MGRPSPPCASAALGIALAVTAGASARPQATTIQIGTVMNAAQEVPAPTGDVSGARGAFTATVTKSDSGASVAWQLSFSGLTGNAVAAHIHQGAPGTPGSVVLALCGPCQSPLSGTGNLTQAALDALEAGDAYVNVHTPTNGAGEIRGQLATTASISTNLNSRQERPKPKGTVRRATGTFTATVTKSGTAGTIAWRLRFSSLTGASCGSAHPHRPERESRPRRSAALWAVPQRRTRNSQPDCGRTGGAREWARVREHPHEEEPGR